MNYEKIKNITGRSVQSTLDIENNEK